MLKVAPALFLLAAPLPGQSNQPLTAAQAAAIESAAAQGKAPPAARLRLLGWYNANPAPERAEKRIALILALAQQGLLGRLAAQPDAAIIRRQGGPLASPEGYARVKAALLERAAKTKLPIDRSNAAWFIFPEEPDEALQIAAENGLLHDTGVLAARFLLGVTTPDARSTGFGRGLLHLVSETADPLFQFAFAQTLRDTGARLYASGQTEWDYTALSNEAFARAAKAEPQQANCGFERAVLPPRGSSSPPEQNEPAPTPGAVTFYALIGCSGFAASLEWLDGPAESVSAAKREIAARHFDVPLSGGQPRQALQLVAAGNKTR